MKYLSIVFVCILLFACNSAENNNTVTDSIVSSPDTTYPEVLMKKEDTVCYEFVSGKDVYTYRLFIKDSLVTGTAHYDNFEKDDSRGTVHGTLNNDIIHLWYNFESEGMQSVSERYFKITSGQITEGIGKIDLKGDTTYFSSPETIDYTKGLVFKQRECE